MTETEGITTENEVPRRLGKVEEGLARLLEEHEKKDPLDRVTPIVAIVALAAIEALALHKGADGAMFAPVIALIAAIAGVKMGDTIRDVFGGKRK